MDAYLGGDGNIDEHLVDIPPAEESIGKVEGFASLPRVTPEILPCEKRCDNFALVDRSFSEATAKAEAQRCLQCPLRTHLTKPKLWTDYLKTGRNGQ